MTISPNEIFRDYVTDGVASSGPFSPVKSEIRTLLNQMAQRTGAWTPTMTLFTPGDLVVAYGSQFGRWSRFNRTVMVHFNFSTTTWTYTTGTGQILVLGVPFSATQDFVGTLETSGFIRAGSVGASHTNMHAVTAGSFTGISFEASGFGTSYATVQAANAPSGGSYGMRGTLIYETDDP